jgi:hypothetical protein
MIKAIFGMPVGGNVLMICYEAAWPIPVHFFLKDHTSGGIRYGKFW